MQAFKLGFPGHRFFKRSLGAAAGFLGFEGGLGVFMLRMWDMI